MATTPSSIAATPAAWGRGMHARAAFAVAALLLAVAFHDGIADLVRQWIEREEYGHGFLIPLVSAYLAWQKRDALERLPMRGSWWGVGLCGCGLALLAVGDLATLYVLVQYALVVVLAGLVLAFAGRDALVLLWAPLAYLLFMIPLPPFLHNELSGAAQLLSSSLGVEVIRLFGISVFLEGNIIDLGHYKLQVVEACNGLRYMFPLLSFGFLCAYLFQAPLWQRLVVLLTPIPITILMNSLRIGVIGVLVDHAGIEMAEGFMHDVEGWMMFAACVGVLVLEMWLLCRLQPGRPPLGSRFRIELPARRIERQPAPGRRLPAPVAGALLLLAGCAIGVNALSARVDAPPPRRDFALFPDTLGEWSGRREVLDARIVERLEVSDYLMADYTGAGGAAVNFYVAWYDSQRKGQSAHSPRSCIPGGGWEIRDLRERALPGAHPLRVNRVEIQRGTNRQLVYYWFRQRGRLMTNEYAVKSYLLWDALTRGRTDGAMVRLVTPLAPGEPWSAADDRLAAFASALGGRLDAYIPS